MIPNSPTCSGLSRKPARVLLEVGDARIRPFIERPVSPWVHDHLQAQGIADEFVSNRPTCLRCIHPLVTLLEKLDAIGCRFKAGTDPSQYVRHFEDVSHIIQAETNLPWPELGHLRVTTQDNALGEFHDRYHGFRFLFRKAACRSAPLLVSRYFCLLLFGLSGMVISTHPPDRAG
jgi:hypothetical protein